MTLCYHDVVDNGAFDASGFTGASAASYKLDADQMQHHLSALASTRPEGVTRVDQFRREVDCPLLLTFDDGGISAVTHTAELLEKWGWKGHFLITAKYINCPGFMTGEQIRELHRRGHVVGSHSWSHPERMSRCSDKVLRDEWSRSSERLSELIGERVEVASVPGGFYSRRVAEAAAAAGIQILFTSEPRKRVKHVGDCRVFGRYNVQRHTSATMVSALTSADWNIVQVRQFLQWNSKKLLKRLGGSAWLAAREAWWRQSMKRGE